MTHGQSLVHIVDADTEVQQLLAAWLADAGVASRMYADPDAFLNGDPPDLPGCLVMDADPAFFPLAVSRPIVVTARCADVSLVVRSLKAGAIDFVEKPLRREVIIAAIFSAIEVDLQKRLLTSRQSALLARLATLSARERQVMTLVTSGKLNKQIGGELGLSEITIKAHRGSVMRKMDARSLADLVRMADALGAELVTPSRSDRRVPTQNAAVVGRRSGYNPAHRRPASFHGAELYRAR